MSISISLGGAPCCIKPNTYISLESGSGVYVYIDLGGASD